MEDRVRALSTFDVFKAFDQLARPSLHALMLRAGFPKPVVTAYAEYMEALMTQGSFSGGWLGQARGWVASLKGAPGP